MKIRFTDWEIEKNNMEDFWGYDFRYSLEEILSENGPKIQVKKIIETNDLNKVLDKIGQLVLKEPKVEFIESDSLTKIRKNFKEFVNP